jgi:hypothetical protein
MTNHAEKDCFKMNSSRLPLTFPHICMALSGAACASYQPVVETSCPWPLYRDEYLNVTRCLPPKSLTVQVRRGMTQQQVESILGPASERVDEDILAWEVMNPTYNWPERFTLSFDDGGLVQFFLSGGAGASPSIDIDVYHH